MEYYVKQFSYAASVWLFILLIDTFRTLFSLVEDGSARGIMGVNIVVTSDSSGLTTDFAFTSQTIWSFLIFVGVWLFIVWILRVVRTSSSISEKSQEL